MDTETLQGRTQAVPGSPDLQARLAVTAEDRLHAFRLRYDVYVQEQQKPYPDADHAQRTLRDGLDDCADVVIVTAATRVVATVRANYLSDAAVNIRYADELALTNFGRLDVRESCVCSRLAASSDRRDTNARRAAFAFIYERGLARGARLCFATCAPGLLPLFLRYGFREYAAPFQDPFVGALHRTLLVMDDVHWLERVHSPFHSQASRLGVAHTQRQEVEAVLLQYEVNNARR